jgi:small subunit ribosomal protein S18
MAERKKFTKKFCKYCADGVEMLDYKDVRSFKSSISERYKIMPRRLTGNCKKHQEMVSKTIKRARQAALIPYIIDRKNVVDNPFEIIAQ